MSASRTIIAVVVPALLCFTFTGAEAQTCPEVGPVDNHTGPGTVACPCFVSGEEGGAVFEAPPGDYPLEILRVGIGWGSIAGGNPQVLEAAINIYDSGLPDPGVAIASLPGPVLTDGFINEFDLEPLPGEIIIDSGEFTITLQFDNDSTIFGPTLVHDGAGCLPGQNVVFAIPGGWNDACTLGVTGNWVFHVVYRPLGCGPMGDAFIRGDADGNGIFNGLADALFTLAFQFQGGPTPPCMEAADADNDGVFNGLSDSLYILGFQFQGGPPPPPPTPPDCGPDDDNALGCLVPPAACL